MNTSRVSRRSPASASILSLLPSVGLFAALAGCATAGSASAPPRGTEAASAEAAQGEHAAAPSAPGKAASSGAEAFTLPSASGSQVSLSDLTQRGPAVVFFYRGYWCSSCRAELKELSSVQDTLEKRGVEVAAISVDEPEDATRMAKRIGVRFPLLRDEGLRVSRAYGAAGADDEFPEPAVVIFGKGGKVHWKQVGELGTDHSFAELVVKHAAEASDSAAR